MNRWTSMARAVCACGVASLVLAAGSWAQAPASSAPTCRQSLDSLDARVRRNYAGFLLEIKGERRSEYDQMLRQVGSRAASTPLESCYQVLSAYTGWFDDPHLFVFQSQTVDSATAAQRAKSLQRVELTEESALQDLQRRRQQLDPIEGIWYEGALRVAIVPEPQRSPGTYVAVVVHSDTAAWPVGAIRARFTRRNDGGYSTDFVTRGFAQLELTARIYKRVLMRLSPGTWGKAFPVAAADTGLLDPGDPRAPTVSLRERSVVISIPSHDPSYLRRLDSLVAASIEQIRTRGLLIIDLRGNEGGSSFTSRALNPLIASDARRVTPFDSGTPVMLSSAHQILYAKRFTGTDTSAFVRSLVARMEANPGQLVSLSEDSQPSTESDSVLSGNWRVAVLVDRGTVSASEVLVLRALRSTRAVVIGEPTAGALDYQSVFIVGLGTGYTRWALGYPTITAHADLPQRGMRGKGIAPEIGLLWASVSDPIGEVESRMRR